VILDEKLELSPASKLVQSAGESPLLVFAGAAGERGDELRGKSVEVIQEPGRDLKLMLEELGRRGIQSVLVEGGANVAGSFLDAGLVNKVSFFIAPKIIGGREAPTAVGGRGVAKLAEGIELRNVEVTQHGADVEFTGYPERVLDA